VSLSVPVELGVLYVRSDAPVGRVVSVRVAPGTVLPYHSTGSGKAILAFASDQLVCAVIARGLPPRTDATITDPDALRADLEATRERGFAIDRGESDVDVGCIAAPVFGRDGQPVAALSCSMTVRGLSPASVHHTGERLVRAARDVEASLAIPGVPPPFHAPAANRNGRV
jgi:IclR family transcriptional regulator, acetate operon repressor